LVDYISKIGYDSTYGARPMKRAIQDKVEDFLSEEVLLGKIKENTQYVIKVEDDVVKITKGK
jgi:ATP-dependent Clp protease ATP-binding subunit ClpC